MTEAPEFALWITEIAADVRMVTLLGVCTAAGIFFGALAWGLWHRRRRATLETELATLRSELKSQQALAEERRLTMEQAEERLAGTFAELANRSLAHNSDSFLKLARQNLGMHQERAKADLGEKQQAFAQLIKPIKETLEQTQKQIGDIEKQRHESFGSITAQLEAMTLSQEALQSQTRNLVTALRRPEVRGQWGELTLRRVVELAGMVEHCDFTEQPHLSTESGAIRPDMIVRMPDRGTIVVDAKTPLDAYLTATEAEDDAGRKLALQRHARNVANRVRELAGKAYWAQFDASPDFVILFIPGDQFLNAAAIEIPTLLEDALRLKVIIATPTSLVGMLKTIAFGWRQLALDENAEKIRELAQDMHGRLTTFTGHLARVGRSLESTVKAYNSAVGSMERKVLPGARKFVELGIHAKGELDAPTVVETTAREIDDRSPDETEELPKIASIEVTNTDPDKPPPAH